MRPVLRRHASGQPVAGRPRSCGRVARQIEASPVVPQRALFLCRASWRPPGAVEDRGVPPSGIGARPAAGPTARHQTQARGEDEDEHVSAMFHESPPLLHATRLDWSAGSPIERRGSARLPRAGCRPHRHDAWIGIGTHSRRRSHEVRVQPGLSEVASIAGRAVNRRVPKGGVLREDDPPGKCAPNPGVARLNGGEGLDPCAERGRSWQEPTTFRKRSACIYGRSCRGRGALTGIDAAQPHVPMWRRSSRSTSYRGPSAISKRSGTPARGSLPGSSERYPRRIHASRVPP